MENSEIRKLAEAFEEAGQVDQASAARAVDAIRNAIPATHHATVDASRFSDTDAVLLMIDRALPGWSITIDGVASAKNGHWVTVLRRSDERDNDPFVGIGKASVLSTALLAALLKALAFLPQR